jgi:ABC-type transport system involved in multi-copper enzyme maturation permease subunit
MNLIRSELMKIRTTNVWWLFGIGVLVFTAISVAIWIAVGNQMINEATSSGVFQPPPPGVGMSPAEIEQQRQQFEMQHDINRVLSANAAMIYTSGQFFGLLFASLLGVILVTNEYYHQTATATFLTTPQRTKVILAKLGTATAFAVIFWVVTTAISVAAGSIFFTNKGYSTQLGEWPVTRAILMNGLAYGLWGILGVGLGVLIRNQIAAVIVVSAGYVLGTQIAGLAALLAAQLFKADWVEQASVAWPAVASQVMVSTEEIFVGANTPPWWVGALILVGWGVVMGLVGTLITRKRDIA